MVNHSNSPIWSLAPALSTALKERTQSTLVRIIAANQNTIYFRESDLLSRYRGALESTESISTELQPTAIHQFHETVPLSSYKDYRPFVSRFFAATCNASDVTDLLAPGLPLFIAHSSGTSGGPMKYFPKYPHEQYMPREKAEQLEGMAVCNIVSFIISSTVNVIGDGSDAVSDALPVCTISTGGFRQLLGIQPRDDEKYMGQRVPSTNTSPYAACLIPSHPLCYLMHGLFAIADSSLASISVSFSTLFYDLICLLEENWDMLVQAVEDGQIPDFGDLNNLKPYLQAQFKANPTRAAELRSIEKSREGWLKKIWPHLAVLQATCSGPYSAIVPKLRYHLGPCVSIQSNIYASTECVFGYSYRPGDANIYKAENMDYFEYLPIEQPEGFEGLVQSWELETGRKYEVVVTTGDGLWRYPLGDIIEVAGFHPRDGQPLVSYLERRHIGLRIAGELVTGRELQDAIHSLEDILGCVLEFTVAPDERKMPRTHGFFVELEDKPGPESHKAPSRLQSALSDGNESYRHFALIKYIGTPTIRVVAHGTFREYRDWKSQLNKCGSNQIKVPAVVHDTQTLEWLCDRVIGEIGSITCPKL